MPPRGANPPAANCPSETTMIEVPVFNQSGQEIEKLQVDENQLGGRVNKALLKQAIVMYHANKRQGTVRTQARGEVAGSTRKLYKQKGTGNARTGGIRNPIKVGGGHAKNKRPKDWRLAMPKKARRAARNSALLAKIQATRSASSTRSTSSSPRPS
jgi:large subunit ribosomal protein L4